MVKLGIILLFVISIWTKRQDNSFGLISEFVSDSAFVALKQSIRFKRQDWKVWDNYLSCAMVSLFKESLLTRLAFEISYGCY
jgi:hypothetical protein